MFSRRSITSVLWRRSDAQMSDGNVNKRVGVSGHTRCVSSVCLCPLSYSSQVQTSFWPSSQFQICVALSFLLILTLLPAPSCCRLSLRPQRLSLSLCVRRGSMRLYPLSPSCSGRVCSAQTPPPSASVPPCLGSMRTLAVVTL